MVLCGKLSGWPWSVKEKRKRVMVTKVENRIVTFQFEHDVVITYLTWDS